MPSSRLSIAPSRTKLPAAAATCLLLLGGCAERAPEPVAEVVRPVRATRVADPTQISRRRFPGTARGTQELELSFRVAGPLIERPVDVGTEVEAGDLVARIDPRDFEVSLRATQGQLAEAQAVADRAQADLDRSLKIQSEDPGAISQAAVDRARQTRDSARASVSSLQATVQDARNQLSYTTLTAPFDGTVVATHVENFEQVRAKQPIVRIVDDSKVEMVVSIPESLITYAPFVTELQVTFDAFSDRPVPAQIKEIGTEASTTTRTFPVTLVMDQLEDIKILPGMAGNAVGDPPPNYPAGRIELPVTAVFSPEADQRSFVWVIDESRTVRRREVQVGELTASGLQIMDGLETGEWVATAGVHYLEEGQKVRLLDEEG